MYLATAVEPTKLMPFTCGCVSNASTAGLPQCTIFITPVGKPASFISSNIRTCERGTCSEGLTIYVLPAATANGQNQYGTIAGKLNGATQAKTPSGRLSAVLSIPLATSSL